MKKIVIYALGTLFHRYEEKIDWSRVVALSDSNPLNNVEINGISLVHPDDLKFCEYDYIAIFSSKYYESIKRELVGKYFVSEEKIVSWKAVLHSSYKEEYDFAKLIKEYFQGQSHKKIMDVGMNSIPHSVLSVDELLMDSNAWMDGVKLSGAIENKSLYRKVYSICENSCEHYDAIIISNYEGFSSVELLKQKSDLIISHVETLESGKMLFEQFFSQDKWELRQISTVEGVLWIAEKRDEIFEKDVALYVVTHKEYGVKNDDLYKPICVGDYTYEGYLSEREGENISYLNSKINECTALYWIWKNMHHEYVGLNHYRRYFYNSNMKATGNYLNKKTICKLLEHYDILLPVTHPMSMSFKEIDRLKTTMDENAFQQGYKLVRNAIEVHQPEYLQAFDDVMNGNNIFVCNMFVTRWDILDAYCEWLFSFLIEVAESADTSAYDTYSQRVIGFFAERMWTVWLRRQSLRIKEMPYDEL